MAIRLLPFRDYDEHDAVNLYRWMAVKETLLIFPMQLSIKPLREMLAYSLK